MSRINKYPLYKYIAVKINAIQNCIKNNNQEWERKHLDSLVEITQFLPRGSGIDSGCEIVLEKLQDNRIIINSSYHAMNPQGFYIGWLDFMIIVRPDLISDFVLDIEWEEYLEWNHNQNNIWLEMVDLEDSELTWEEWIDSLDDDDISQCVSYQKECLEDYLIDTFSHALQKTLVVFKEFDQVKYQVIQ